MVSQEDNLLNMLLDCHVDDEYDDAGDDTGALIIDIENLEPGMAAKQGPYSVDSVSTFATHPDKPAATKKSPVTSSSVSSKSTANTKKKKDSQSVASNAESIDYMASRISQIETSLVDFKMVVEEIKELAHLLVAQK